MSRGLRLTPEQYRAMGSAKQPRIKNTRRKTIDGIDFDSTREARRYQDLLMLQQSGQIFELRRQVPYPIDINGVHVCDYMADFVYREGGCLVVEDCKGFRTDIYKLKRKLVLACHGVTVRET